MDSVEDFFSAYQLDDTYRQQDERHGDRAIKPFDRQRHPFLSHGVIPGFRRYDLFYERYRAACEHILASGALPESPAILDVGCGEGFFKVFFEAMVSEDGIWNGVELWRERADFCRAMGYARVKDDVDLDQQSLPFADASMDMVIALHVIEHIRDPAAMLAEMVRVLKPGGIMVVATPTKPPGLCALLLLLYRCCHSRTGETQQVFTHYSLSRLIRRVTGWDRSALIDKSGQRIVSSRKRLPLENWRWYYALSVWLGRRLQSLAPEVNIIMRKPPSGA